MKLLLDTHVLLWWLDDPDLLTPPARAAIARDSNAVFVSAAVVWEIAIKKALGKLRAPDDLEAVMEEERFQPLSIAVPHALAVASLPSVHQDPSDRIQVAQAQLESLTLVTRDTRLQQYGVPYIDA